MAIEATQASPAQRADAAALLVAGQVLADRNVFGIAWIDTELIVRARYGRKADFIAVGAPVTDSVIPFFGAEEEIAGLQHDPAGALELPGVVIVSGAETQERYNLSLFWSPDAGCYLLLIARASLDAALEVELLRHVRARLMAEAQIKSKSDELARANKELEDFAAIISHDLKAPMRALQYASDDIAQALNQPDGQGLAEARARVAWVNAQTRRMAGMLSTLLDYSSIGRKSRAIETVATRSLVEAIVQSLPKPPGFVIEIGGDWPTIDTLKAPLDLVIRNLLDNALKHHDRAHGHIAVTCQPAGHTLIISITDDGPGIAPDHAHAIFLPFRTLAMGDVAPVAGIGMGLALVERTTASVGGEICVVPTPPGARGATFIVTWPTAIMTGA